MRQIQLYEPGQPRDVVRVAEAPDPGMPHRDQVLVKVEAFPINPADLLLLRGFYPRDPDDPAQVGFESAGTVEAVGPDVIGLVPGDRVVPLGTGNWSEKLLLPQASLLKIDRGIPLPVAAGLKVNPAPAQALLSGFAELRAGDWILQNAANSSVGRSVIEIAAARGLKTVNVVRREDVALELAALGADIVLVDGDDLAARVAEATGGCSPRLALDAVAGAASGRLAANLAEGGTLAVYGAMSGEAMRIEPALMVFRDLSVRSFWMTKYLTEAGPAEIAALYDPVLDLARRGPFRPMVTGTFPVERIADALDNAEATMGEGKTLVSFDPI